MNCKNCQTSLSETADYCYDCGGKVIRNRLTIRNLFEHFSETFFNYDNQFLQTFIHLFTKPDVVIGCYIKGTRKKYVDVVSYFALAITLSGLQLFILNKFYPEAMNMSEFTTKGQEEWNNGVMNFMQEYQSLVMMLYVPMYALISKIVFFNKKMYNYTEQIVIYMYIQAQVSIVSAFIMTFIVMLGFNYLDMSFPFIGVMIFYTAYCLKRLYHLTYPQIILKTLLFGLILSAFFLFVVIAGVIIAIANGSMSEMIEANKGLNGS